MNFPFPFAFLDGASGSGTDWTLSFEGFPAGWAFLSFLVLSAATVFAYLKLLPLWRRAVLIALRIAIFAVFFVLVVKPVVTLTLSEPVRQGLLVAVDASQSMEVKDRRERPEDLVRAAIAAGSLPPDGGLQQKPPADAAQALGNISRWELLKKLAENKNLNFWPGLNKQADLLFYRFGREAVALPTVSPESFGSAEARQIFETIRPDQPATGIGDALRQILQEDRSRPVGALLLVTDGQSNVGSSPLEVAVIAREQGVPLFIYGVGVTSPPDIIVEELGTKKLSFVKERVEVRAKIRTQGLKDKSATAVLRVNGVDKDEKTFEISDDGEQTVELHFVPEDPGEAKIEVAVEPLPEESSKDNNIARAQLRVTDSKFHVLLIEQEPRWDFRYLLAYLQRDSRLEVRCSVIDGEPGLDRKEEVYLPSLPDGREEFFKNEVIILGDVNPRDLGMERMEAIRDWVEAGGGIIFLAGPKFNPSAYTGTPLETLLPVMADASLSPQLTSQRAPEVFKLGLTPQGEISPYLQMDPDPDQNRIIWEGFPGVRWTARVLRAKPNSEVLLVDSRPLASSRYGANPVFAIQHYGAGTCVYLGTDETYRWRSGEGEKYYSILWGQIMQSLALELLEGGSARTQLKADRREYVLGDKALLSARVYGDGFTPLIAPSVEAVLRTTTTGPDGQPTERQETVNLSASAQGGFRLEFEPKTPGDYSLSLNRDSETVLHFAVVEPRLEKVKTALNDRLLRAVAEASGGRFLREEDLHGLSKLIREKSAVISGFKRIELFHSTWWLAVLVVLAGGEWLLRRLTQLK